MSPLIIKIQDPLKYGHLGSSVELTDIYEQTKEQIKLTYEYNDSYLRLKVILILYFQVIFRMAQV